MNTDKRLEQITSTVVSVAKPQRIFLLGTLSSQYTADSIFTTPPATWSSTTHFFLLVLISGDENKAEVQNTIEDNCHPIGPVTAMVMSMVTFNDLAVRDNLFAKRVYYEAQELYSADEANLLAPSLHGPNQDCTKEAEGFLKRAEGFLASVEFHLLRREVNLAAFMVHQSFEQLCLSILKIKMGIRVTAHNLDKLYRYVWCFSGELVQLFPRNSENEERLFALAKHAYIDTRYTQDYRAREEDIEILLERLKLFVIHCRSVIKTEVTVDAK